MPTHRLIDGDLAPYAQEEPTALTLAEWREGARPDTGSGAGRFALVLPNDVALAEFDGSFDDFAAVILEFPIFRDGRAYSQARLLRERYGYKGEIRARGNVLRDQARFMIRAGFDAFEIDGGDVEGFRDAINEISFVYQHAADTTEPVWRLRAARAAAA